MKQEEINHLEKEVKQYIGKAKYDKEGFMIFANGEDGQQLLLDIRGWGHLCNKFPTDQDAACFTDAIGQFVVDAINTQLTRPNLNLEEIEKPKWISVDERLPDKNGVYLCYLFESNYEGISQSIRTLVFVGKTWGVVRGEVTHWQPLPQPPTSDDLRGEEINPYDENDIGK